WFVFCIAIVFTMILVHTYINYQKNKITKVSILQHQVNEESVKFFTKVMPLKLRDATSFNTKPKPCPCLVQMDPDSLNSFFCFAFPLASLLFAAIYFIYVITT
ncbi:unnamed protein product, partial [Meganyctiphanes norvegica]